MSTKVYNDVLKRAQRLSPDEQLRLLEDVAHLLRRQAVTKSQRRSILEIRGLGKEIWEGIDAQGFVDQERASWTG